MGRDKIFLLWDWDGTGVKIKMIIKVSHCSSGKIMVSGHNVGSTDTQGEGEARSKQ